MKPKSPDCPCGSPDYAACCGRYHHGKFAPDAEALMRSRYSAYVLKLEDYLYATWHATTRPGPLALTDDKGKWMGLEVKSYVQESADRATVEFVARYKVGGQAHRLHEISRFVREDGRWYYVDGQFDDQ